MSLETQDACGCIDSMTKCGLVYRGQLGGPHFFPIPLTSTTFWRVLMAFSRTGSTDCMIPSLLSISLIYGCIPSMAFIFLATSTSGCPSSSLFKILAVRAFWMFLMAAVLATAASASPLASDERADERGDSRLKELVFVHGLELVSRDGGDKGGGEFHLERVSVNY